MRVICAEAPGSLVKRSRVRAASLMSDRSFMREASGKRITAESLGVTNPAALKVGEVTSWNSAFEEKKNDGKCRYAS